MRLPHRLQGQKVKSQGHGAGAYCGGDLVAQLVFIVTIIIIIIIIIKQTLCVTFALCHRKSVCLSSTSAALLHPT